jgi:hypothetical protein
VTFLVRLSDPDVPATVIVYVPKGVEGKTVTVAEAFLLVSAWDIALTVTLDGVGTEAGAV